MMSPLEPQDSMNEPFVTLSEESRSDSSPSYSSDDSTPLSTPPPSTHDTRRAGFHVKDLEGFAEKLQNAANRAFPNEGRTQPRYKSVSVLLIRWEDDEMNVEWELDDLEKVFMRYGFETERWLIPRKNAHLKLMSKAVDVVERFEGSGEEGEEESLVIVYYAGHAFINQARQSTWSCKSDASYATLEWSAIQTLFEKANFDVLLLLDCCAAASAAPTVGSAVTETIAACGFESIAPQPGRFSFTNSLIEVLDDWIDGPPFSAAMLHNKVLSVLKHERPERAQNGKRRKLECRRTPIHIVASADAKLPSIELGRRRQPSSRFPFPEQLTSIRSVGSSDSVGSMSGSQFTGLRPQSFESLPQAIGKRKEYEQEYLQNVTDGDFEVPRVIISLALEQNQTLNAETCQKWLTSCPALVKHAKIEAVYKSFSTLLLLSLPVMIWDLLPDDPACSFVGYITSSNMLHTPSLDKEKVVESCDIRMEDVSPLTEMLPISNDAGSTLVRPGFSVTDLIASIRKIERMYEAYEKPFGKSPKIPLHEHHPPSVKDLLQDLRSFGATLWAIRDNQNSKPLSYSSHAAIVRTLEQCAKVFEEELGEVAKNKGSNSGINLLWAARWKYQEEEIRRLQEVIRSHHRGLRPILQKEDAGVSAAAPLSPLKRGPDGLTRFAVPPKDFLPSISSMTTYDMVPRSKISSTDDGQSVKDPPLGTKEELDMASVSEAHLLPKYLQRYAAHEEIGFSTQGAEASWSLLHGKRYSSHDDSITHATSEEAPASRKRTACTTCRIRKIKCDGSRPICSMCFKSKRVCGYGEEPKKMTISPEYVKALEERIRQLKSVLQGERINILPPYPPAAAFESGDEYDSSSTVQPQWVTKHEPPSSDDEEEDETQAESKAVKEDGDTDMGGVELSPETERAMYQYDTPRPSPELKPLQKYSNEEIYDLHQAMFNSPDTKPNPSSSELDVRDPQQRRRIQNRLAQRKFRDKIKKHLGEQGNPVQKFRCHVPGCLRDFKEEEAWKKHLDLSHPEFAEALGANMAYFKSVNADQNAPSSSSGLSNPGWNGTFDSRRSLPGIEPPDYSLGMPRYSGGRIASGSVTSNSTRASRASSVDTSTNTNPSSLDSKEFSRESSHTSEQLDTFASSVTLTDTPSMFTRTRRYEPTAFTSGLRSWSSEIGEEEDMTWGSQPAPAIFPSMAVPYTSPAPRSFTAFTGETTPPIRLSHVNVPDHLDLGQNPTISSYLPPMNDPHYIDNSFSTRKLPQGSQPASRGSPPPPLKQKADETASDKPKMKPYYSFVPYSCTVLSDEMEVAKEEKADFPSMEPQTSKNW